MVQTRPNDVSQPVSGVMMGKGWRFRCRSDACGWSVQAVFRPGERPAPPLTLVRHLLDHGLRADAATPSPADGGWQWTIDGAILFEAQPA